MLMYAVSIAFAWLCWKVVRLLLKWQTAKQCVEGLPLAKGHHWFYGLVHRVKNQGDLINILQDSIEETTPRWIAYWNLCVYPVICPATPDAIQAILSANGIPKNHGIAGPYRIVQPWIGDGLLASNGAKWARNRRLLTPAFHFDILKPYVDIFNEVADIYLTMISNKSMSGTSFDIMPLISRATLHALLRCVLSYEDVSEQALGDQNQYLKATQRLKYHTICRSMNPLLYIDAIYQRTGLYKDFKSQCDYIHKFSADVIAERRKAIEKDQSHVNKQTVDFLDILLTAHDENGTGLTDKEIQDEVDTFMFEGHDTTMSAVSWAIYSMAKYPELRARIREEVTEVLRGRHRLTAEDLGQIPYTTCFIKEVLRMYTPVPTITRKLDTPRTIDGIQLPEGQVIDIFPYLIHHNPKVWDKHLEFRPERFLPENMANKHPFAFVPFAAGQRNCIGQHFAMNEIKIWVCRIAQRFDLLVDQDKEPVPYPELVMGAKDGIHLFVKERQ